MKKFAQFAAASGAALALAACGSADDASVEAEADTVEMPADEALAGVEEEPVADEDAMSDETPAPVTEEEASSAADAAEDVVAAAEAAAAAAAAAAGE